MGRFEGMVVFVPLTAPGDLVTAELVEVKKNFATATLIQIEEPGPSRREAPCEYYGKCGGCNWQHVTYEEQLNQKNQMISHLISKKWPKAIRHPIMASENEWRYRRRVQVHAEKNVAGFLKRASHDIVDIKDCLITEERVTSKFESLKSGNRRKKFEIVRKTNNEVEVIDLEKNPYMFMQVNESQNRKMIESVVEQVAKEKPNEILDLYCGAGNFSIPLAKKFPGIKVSGVEESPISSGEGRQRGSNLSNLEIVTDDTARFLKDCSSLRDAVVVMDPPRAGVSAEVIALLKHFKPKSIVYVSCHPATASRDWSALGPEYSLLQLTPFDMFPQTDHVELIATLSDPTRLD